jgi:hypothetical protein
MLEKKLKSGKIGSALIMTVVLTVLLAIVAVTFVLVARMDSAATGNVSDSKSLDNAAKSIIDIIGKELVFDTPGVAEKAGIAKNNNTQQYFDYQDYPDVNDAWLASIEPYRNDANEYRWRQISDVTGYLKNEFNLSSVENIWVEPENLSTTTVVREYSEIKTDSQGRLEETSADADGDGIADSKWFELSALRSSKGKPVYAAVRVIDNCAMLNLNTACVFDSNSGKKEEVDGTSQLQINLKGLLKGGDKIDDFHKARCNGSPESWGSYENSVIWNYGIPDGNYVPFDISDELELRYRYCIDGRFESRLEADANAIPKTIRGAGTDDFGNLYDGSANWGLPAWKSRITDTNENGDRRHLLTAYNFDSIIDPNGRKMFDVKADPNVQELYKRLVGSINPDLSDTEKDKLSAELAQIAANIVDRSDNDSNISIVRDIRSGKDFYGDEPPFMFISEIVRSFEQDANGLVHRSYAIELRKNYDSDSNFAPWRLEISGISGSAGANRNIFVDVNDFIARGGEYFVIIFEDAGDPNVFLQKIVKYTDSPQNGAKNVDPNVTLRWDRFLMGFDPNSGAPILSSSYDLYYGTDKSEVDANSITPAGGEYVPLPSTRYKPAGGFALSTPYYWKVVGKGVIDGNNVQIIGPIYSFTTWDKEPDDVNEMITAGTFIFDSNTAIRLYRPIYGSSKSEILVDEVVNMPDWFIRDDVPPLASPYPYSPKSYQREMRWSLYLRRLWDLWGNAYDRVTLGSRNDWMLGTWPISPWHHSFTNIGDVAMVFRKSTYLEGDPAYQIRQTDAEVDVRFDVEDANMQNIFKYITVFNPSRYGSNDDNERRVRGRLNINTAPKFVIEQLPWVSRVNNRPLNIADAIAAYRDKLDISADGGPDYSGNLGRYNATQIKNISESPGFKSIGELMNVINDSGKNKYDIRYCGRDGKPQYKYPDLTFGSMSGTDDVQDDLEEEELIFARISDLATVRSDVFTAYILVRLGVDGPQKRFMVILDRSDVYSANDKVSIAAFQQTPPAR